MTIGKMIRRSLWHQADEWHLDKPERFLRRKGVELVRSVYDNRWRYIVPGLGQVVLPVDVQWRINWMRKGLRIKSEMKG